jgi:hypothetical protein
VKTVTALYVKTVTASPSTPVMTPPRTLAATPRFPWSIYPRRGSSGNRSLKSGCTSSDKQSRAKSRVRQPSRSQEP